MSGSMRAEGVPPTLQTVKGAAAALEPDETQRAIKVVMACDGNYAMPLATALRSMADAHRGGPPLHVHVLVDDFPAALQARVQASVPAAAVSIVWLPVNLQEFAGFETLPGISKMTFARLLIPSLFPQHVKRVLYVDVDVLVLDDLAKLWATPLGGCVIGAVTDGLDAQIKSGEPWLGGLPRVRQYFNAGVLLIDLERWREAGISERATRYLIDNAKSAYSDQDALNVACDRQWLPLDTRWNFQQHLETRVDRLAGHELPGLVHFVTGRKPWLANSCSQNAALYDRVRSRTRFARSRSEVARDAFIVLTMPLRRWLRQCGVLHALRAVRRSRNVSTGR